MGLRDDRCGKERDMNRRDRMRGRPKCFKCENSADVKVGYKDGTHLAACRACARDKVDELVLWSEVSDAIVSYWDGERWRVTRSWDPEEFRKVLDR